MSESVDPPISPNIETSEVRPRTSPAVWLLGLAAFLLLTSFVFIEPTMHWLLHGVHDLRMTFRHPNWPEIIEQTCLQMITLLWFFMLGGSFGSFLHCLEYRVPRGISIAEQGSSCPGCHTKIKAWHNVPVFGWLLLRGRCAACGWSIPVRYPLAELVFGSVFVALLAVELIGGGCNLPLVFAVQRVGVSETIWFPRWNLIGFYTFHITLLMFLMTWCLFALDRFRVPRTLVVLGIVIGIVCPLVWPHYYPLNANGLFNAANHRLPALLSELAGLGVGVFLGVLISRNRAENVYPGDRFAACTGSLLVGLFLGWQFAVGTAVIALLFRSIGILTPSAWYVHRWPVVIWLTLATLVQLICWRLLLTFPLWPGNPLLGIGVMLYPLLMMLLSALLDVLESRATSQRSLAEHNASPAPPN